LRNCFGIFPTSDFNFQRFRISVFSFSNPTVTFTRPIRVDSRDSRGNSGQVLRKFQLFSFQDFSVFGRPRLAFFRVSRSSATFTFTRPIRVDSRNV
jgi:hypothetical protein